MAWQDMEDMERRTRLANQMMSAEAEPNQTSQVTENDQNPTGMDMETMGSINVDDLTTNMMEAEKENRPMSEEEEPLKVFLVSGVEYTSALTETLGRSEIQSSGEFDSTVTHIVINKITRSEKMLCCTAAGRWVLHPNYFTDSHEVSTSI